MSKRRSILVVDDERSITDALSLVLADQGYEVTTAGSSSEACTILATTAGFDLVFTDLRLPDASGIDLLSKINEANSQT